MNKVFTLVLLVCQTALFAQNSFECGFDSARLQLQSQDTNWQDNLSDHLAPVHNHLNNLQVPQPKNNTGKLNKTTPALQARFVIPVVIHVLHKNSDYAVGMGSNISDSQILHQLNHLNRAFRNADEADSMAVNTGIQFCLANKDINGNTTTGIVRKSSDTLTYFKMLDGLPTPADTLFPEEKYLNIYIVSEIVDKNGVPSSVKGIGTHSFEFTGNGIVMVYDWFGNVNQCPNCPLHAASVGNVLVHEAGHYFGLYHTFEGQCTDSTSTTCASHGDLCCDTPPVDVPNRNCDQVINSCNEQNDRPDMLKNYMDYALGCATTFTLDQSRLMQAYVLSYRSELIEASNVLNAGAGGCNYHTALFSASQNLVCDSGWVTFTALDKNKTCVWTIKNSAGDTLVHTQLSDTLSYFFNTIDQYDVSLQTIVGSDTMAMSRAALVQVANCGTPITSTQGNWYFGNYAGIKFTQGGAFRDLGAFGKGSKQILTQSSTEGTVTRSNAQGQLLFYGGSTKIGNDYFYTLYNAEHDTMKGGKLPTHDYSSSAQSGLIVPHPQDTNKFYLLVNEAYGVGMNESGLHYSIIDMTGAGGKGEVLSNRRNLPVKGPSAYAHSADSAMHTDEGMTVVPACNGIDHWLITTDWDNFYINVFLIHNDTIEWKNRYDAEIDTRFFSTLTASPDGTKLACRGGILNFDRATGQVSLYKAIPIKSHHHCFSPNSKVLYTLDKGSILQWNVYENNPQYKIIGRTPFYAGEALQLGPDNKIYIINFEKDFVSTINLPNNLKTDAEPNACGFQPMGVDLSEIGDQPSGKSGIPNIITAKKIIEIEKDFNYLASNCKTVKFSTANYCANTYKWLFDDGNTSTQQNPTHTYATESTYNVKLIIDGDTVSKIIKLEINEPSIVGDIDVCDTNQVQFYSLFNSNPADQYTWSLISGGSLFQINQNSAQVTWNGGGTLRVNIVGDNGCTGYIEKVVVILPHLDSNILALSQNYYCGNDSIEIIGNIPTGGNGVYTYVWQQSFDSINWATISGATSKNHIINNPLQTIYLRRIAKSSNCSLISNVSKVIIGKPVNTISPKYPSTPYCYYGADGSDPAIGSVEIKYKWLVSNQINNNYFSPYNFNQRDTLKNLAFENRPDRNCKIYRIVQYNNCFDTSAIKELNIKYITKHPDDVNKCYSLNSSELVSGSINSSSSNNRIIWQIKPKLGSSWQEIVDTMNINKFSYKYMLDSNIQSDTVRFKWIISNNGCYDTLISNNAIIKTDYTKPHITSIFTNITVDQFVTLNYVVTASNSSNANYNWQVKAAGTNFWAPLNNNSATLELSPVEFCQNGNTYRVIVTNACGSDTSNNSILTVNQFIYTLLHDIWMKDNTKDTAAEPNTFVDPSNITLDVYRSPDIWNCKDNSSCLNHENAEYKTSSPNYAQVKVRNKGPYQTNHDNLRVYWTHCSTGEIWDESWIGTNKNRFWNADSAKYFPLGGEITGINGSLISNLDANDSVIISLPWYPPNPKWYYSYDSGSKVYEKSACICLLARIEQCNKYPFGMTSPERFGLKIQDNVIKNNNIVTRNIAVLDEINGNFKVKSEWTGVGRVMNDCDSFEILLKPEYSSFFDDWIVEVILDDTISKLWFAGGEQGSGFTILDSNRLLVDENEQFSIKNICLKKDQLAFVAVEFTAKDTTNNIPVKAYDVALWQQDLNNGPDSYQGGFIYRIENSDNQLNNNYTSYKRKPNFKDKTESLPAIWNVFPNPARNQISVAFNSNFEGQANIELVDVFGKKIYLSKIDIVKGEQLTILNTDYLANGTYFIRLYTPEIVGTRKVVVLKE